MLGVKGWTLTLPPSTQEYKYVPVGELSGKADEMLQRTLQWISKPLIGSINTSSFFRSAEGMEAVETGIYFGIVGYKLESRNLFFRLGRINNLDNYGCWSSCFLLCSRVGGSAQLGGTCWANNSNSSTILSDSWRRCHSLGVVATKRLVSLNGIQGINYDQFSAAYRDVQTKQIIRTWNHFGLTENILDFKNFKRNNLHPLKHFLH